MSRIAKTEWGMWVDIDMVVAVSPCTYHDYPDVGEDFSILFKFLDGPMVISSNDSYFANDVSKLRAAQERFVELWRSDSATNPANHTPFPWTDARIDDRVLNRHHWQMRWWENGKWQESEPNRPESFEDFIRIGRDALMKGRAETRQIGRRSIEKLDPIFEENGFGERWMSS